MKNEKYNISGMACAACSAAVNRVVSKLEGVISCDVNLLTNKMTVNYNEKTVCTDDIIRVVEKAGFGIELEEEKSVLKDKSGENDKKSKAWIPLVVSAFFTSILLYVSMGQMMFGLPLPKIIDIEAQPYNFTITQLILTLPALITGRRFFTKGIPLLFHGRPNMDSLVAVGAGASFIYSLVMTYTISSNPHAVHNLYFEGVAVVITLVMLGKFLESRSKNKTADAIKKLTELSPETAVILKDGVEYTVTVSEVKVGDIAVVKSGARIPLDGVIKSGFSQIDESMITGESMPVDKKAGDCVTGGSINTNGLITVEITKIGEDTTLSKIIKFVEEAQSKKAPIAKTADKVAGIFVPSVIIIAVISAIVWFIIGKDVAFVLKIFTGVLVVACPCALGLATPTAIMVGTGLGAANGILIRNGEVLEGCHKIRVAVFDKTGTVTNGKPVVTDLITKDENQLISLAVAAESGSEHPLARAIREYALKSGIDEAFSVAEFVNIAGKGTVCNTSDGQIILGKPELLEEYNVDVSEFKSKAKELSAQGKSVIFLSFNGAVKGLIAVADEVKIYSIDAMEKLRKMGIKTVLLSGDNQLCAEYIGKKIGVDEVYSEILPNDKALILKRIREKYGLVMMVGDGINDAPALSEADVGCAMGEGSDIAIESADIVLMKNNPLDVVKAVKLSRLTIKNIKQNLFWAFGYNTVLIPIAAGVLYHFGILLNPMLCGLAMSLSSVFVVCNALRLRNKKL